MTPTLTKPSDLFTQDLAGTHKRTRTGSVAPDADTLAAYDANGYVILKGLLSDNTGCPCPECGPNGRGGPNGLISPEMLKAKGALSKKGPAVDELKHHGINFEATEEVPKLDANWAKSTLTALMQKGAYYLSPIMTAIGLGPATGSAAAMDAEPTKSTTTTWRTNPRRQGARRRHGGALPRVECGPRG